MVFNITKFSNELLDDLDNLKGWPDKVKLMQKNWIGKSLGCEIDFQIHNEQKKLKFLQRDLIQYLEQVLLHYQANIL